MTPRFLIAVAPAALAVLALSQRAVADLTVPSALTGGYRADGTYSNSPAFQNYRVGHSPVTTIPERRNFLNFDLTGYPALPPGSVTGGSLNLYIPHHGPGSLDPGEGYISPDPFEVYHVTST